MFFAMRVTTEDIYFVLNGGQCRRNGDSEGVGLRKCLALVTPRHATVGYPSNYLQ